MFIIYDTTLKRAILLDAHTPLLLTLARKY